jgi:hypothetical protein
MMKYNPKTELWKVMSDISKKYYSMDKFERYNMNTFVEDKTQLTKVGSEMFDSFGLDDTDISFFVDVCAAPGMYSKLIFDKKTSNKITGIGISLPPEKGGVEFNFIHNNYKQFYKDILEKQYKLEIPKKLDFGMGSCVSYITDSKNAHQLNMELILTSSNIIMSNLSIGGNMIINMSIKNIYTCYNILYLFQKYFTEIKLWKSATVWGTKNTFYIFCYKFRMNEYNNDIIHYVNDIKDNNSNFNNTFIGDKKTFDTITTLLNPIYMVRINCWLNLIAEKQNK